MITRLNEVMVALYVALLVNLLAPLQMRVERSWVGKGLRGEEGQLVEYALLVLLIAIACIAALTLLGTRVRDVFNRIADALR
ncbi:MAG: Flp family type IVb pilin [Candidatus Hadarchaeales archaeon]